MSTRYLFSEMDFGAYADEIRKTLASRIEKITDRHFQISTVDEIAEDLHREFALKPPVLRMDQVFQRKPMNIKIGIDSEYNGKVQNKIEGTRFEIILPFIGSGDLLQIRPTVYSFDPPYGEIEQDGVHFVYEVQIFHDNKIVRTSFDQNYLNIQYWLDNLSKDIYRFNASLEKDITGALKNRFVIVSRLAISENNFLGFPIK